MHRHCLRNQIISQEGKKCNDNAQFSFKKKKKNGKGTGNHLAATSIPQINTITQPHSQNIVRRPIHKVQIKIVLQCGCIQNLVKQQIIHKPKRGKKKKRNIQSEGHQKENFYLVRRPWNLSRSFNRVMIRPRHHIIVHKRCKRVHRLPGFRFVTKYISAWWVHK